MYRAWELISHRVEDPSVPTSLENVWTGIPDTGKAEICQLELALATDEYVQGLEILVNDKSKYAHSHL